MGFNAAMNVRIFDSGVVFGGQYSVINNDGFGKEWPSVFEHLLRAPISSV